MQRNILRRKYHGNMAFLNRPTVSTLHSMTPFMTCYTLKRWMQLLMPMIMHLILDFITSLRCYEWSCLAIAHTAYKFKNILLMLFFFYSKIMTTYNSLADFVFVYFWKTWQWKYKMIFMWNFYLENYNFQLCIITSNSTSNKLMNEKKNERL